MQLQCNTFRGMKEIIIVYGNMGSGKSTFAKCIAKRLPQYTYICLDDFRKINLDDVITSHKYDFERKVAGDTKKAFEKPSQIIYETTGATLFFKDIYQHFLVKGYRLFIIKIDCPKDVCYQRYHERKETGHYHINPQYRKALGPQELIDRFEKKSAWVVPSLILDSVKLSPDEMVNLFLKRYFKESKFERLEKIMLDFDYNTALDWFNTHVEGKFFIKDMLAKGRDEYNILKLKKELNQIIHEHKSTPSIPVMAPPPKKAEKPKEHDHDDLREELEELRSKVEELEDDLEERKPKTQIKEQASYTRHDKILDEEWKPLFSQAHWHFVKMDEKLDQETNRQYALKVLDLMDEVQEVWRKKDFVRDYGQLPNFDKKQVDNMPLANMMRRINTLRSYISKAKKGKLNPEKVPAWNDELQVLISTVNEQ